MKSPEFFLEAQYSLEDRITNKVEYTDSMGDVREFANKWLNFSPDDGGKEGVFYIMLAAQSFVRTQDFEVRKI